MPNTLQVIIYNLFLETWKKANKKVSMFTYSLWQDLVGDFLLLFARDEKEKENISLTQNKSTNGTPNMNKNRMELCTPV